ncbi:MAG: YifB family Mg chelatase-like AAA ATPase [Cyanobium sp. MAG06]|nr:YifB family Mg chelatase-like AAA ATPase [Cyanobium sp. MAG06]
MKVSRTYSAQVSGLSGVPISVETDVSNGIYSFIIVGLPDQSVGESKERVHSALKNSGVDSPKSRNHKLTVSLAPADIRKEGPIFDLAIAISYLASVGDIENKNNILNESVFIGELSLMGELQSIKGALPIAVAVKNAGFKKIFLPFINREEAALIDGLEIYGAHNVKEVIDHLTGNKEIEKTENIKLPITKNKYPDMGEVVGQQIAKRALQIAAAGGHNICLYGPPGTGKTMLAKAFTGILPDLTFDEALEVTSIHSIIGSKEVYENKIISSPPLRAPHHTASYVSIIGGGSIPKPGEITLAHRGVLFLDEFPEYDSKALESMREPLEDCIVRISRARGSETFPAEFILIAAMNPCPCGYAGSKVKECVCKGGEIERYQKKISGPIMDRIDL